MTDRAYHHGNLRAELLERARQAIEADGADALSLRGLARDLGVSHGASARHFRDKRALFDALAIEGFEALGAAVETAAAGGGPYSERLAAMGGAYVEFAVRHPQLLAVMYAAKHETDASAELVELAHSGKTALLALIVEAQAAGAIRPGDAEEFATIAFASAHGVAALATAGLLDLPVEQAAAAMAAFMWAGLAAPAASPHHV